MAKFLYKIFLFDPGLDPGELKILLEIIGINS